MGFSSSIWDQDVALRTIVGPAEPLCTTPEATDRFYRMSKMLPPFLMPTHEGSFLGTKQQF
jgi:hypothetical protein